MPCSIRLLFLSLTVRANTPRHITSKQLDLSTSSLSSVFPVKHPTSLSTSILTRDSIRFVFTDNRVHPRSTPSTSGSPSPSRLDCAAIGSANTLSLGHHNVAGFFNRPPQRTI
ncbi:predicted protein [Uncinocarpus reesii 1704]|uniref:Uncharacterized protein n=1 Tax=Uncinocarpus reesii (strain UAMH 1704) TaxID=336963 RepID=C4JQY1_UNCRE|nr:uncharacterized protein UREG_03463 [Uncinocarpus reesii 1704]EEP78617.1 predicted protein [Uncinocarpus reesii 1704]